MDEIPRFIGGAWRCGRCGRVQAINLPNPTSHTQPAPHCHCESGVFNIMTPLDDGAYFIEDMNGDPYGFCKRRASKDGEGSR